jgi:hypothetical protein
MSYVNQETGEILTLNEIRDIYVDLSIPNGADLTEYGYSTLELIEKPIVSENEIAVEDMPEEYELGKWRQVWRIEPKPEEPIPKEVLAIQGMLALEQVGLVNDFLNWKNSLDPVTDFKTLAFLEKTTTWRYDSPIIDKALNELNLFDQKDNLFRLASTIEI